VKGQAPFGASSGGPGTSDNPVTVFTLGTQTGQGEAPINCPGQVDTPVTGGLCTVPAGGSSLNSTALPFHSDVLDLGDYIKVPTGTPGSPGSGYTETFAYALTGV
jgi:hypothetical protein